MAAMYMSIMHPNVVMMADVVEAEEAAEEEVAVAAEEAVVADVEVSVDPLNQEIRELSKNTKAKLRRSMIQIKHPV